MAELPDGPQQGELAWIETIGSVLWFLMDGCWMLNQGAIAKGLIIPSLIANLWLFRYTGGSFNQISIVGATNAWLVMNICWMLGDLDKDARAMAAARAMLVLGMLLLVLAVGRNVMHPARMRKVLGRFRRLRI